MYKIIKGLAVVILFSVIGFNGCVLAEEAKPGDLVGWWSFDEGKGIIAKDKSSYGNDGTLKSHENAELPTWIEGKFGYALQFTPKSYVQVPNSESLNLANAFTIATWVKLNWSMQATRTIVSKGISGSTNALYWLYYRVAWGGWNVEFGDGKCKKSSVFDYKHEPTPGEWYHLAITFDNGNLAFYLNGIQVNEKKDVITSISTPLSSDLFIGAYAPWGHYINGVIDELKIFNRALNADEIKKEYINECSSAAS